MQEVSVTTPKSTEYVISDYLRGVLEETLKRKLQEWGALHGSKMFSFKFIFTSEKN